MLGVLDLGRLVFRQIDQFHMWQPVLGLVRITLIPHFAWAISLRSLYICSSSEFLSASSHNLPGWLFTFILTIFLSWMVNGRNFEEYSSSRFRERVEILNVSDCLNG